MDILSLATHDAPLGLFAYVGPSTGITLLGALAAVLLAILFAVGGLLVWPIRALLRRMKTHPAESGEGEQT